MDRKTKIFIGFCVLAIIVAIFFTYRRAFILHDYEIFELV